VASKEERQVSSWIPISSTIANRTEVRVLARTLGIADAHAVGLCVIFWSWVDAESADGSLPRVVAGDIDAVVKHPGFADALEGAGWLLLDDGGAIVPKFDRWMGQSAKRRAQDQRRKRAERERGKANV
jgi:hypothetical protein